MTNTEAAIPEAVGDWNLRGYDIDTLLVREVHGTLIDADRLVRTEFNNGFLNWEMFRAAYAKEAIHVPKLRRWAHEFGIAHVLSEVRKRNAYSLTMAGTAGLDAMYMLLELKPMFPHTVIAEEFGVDPKTYKGLRDGLRDRMSASLTEYVLHLGAAYRQVLIYERRQ